MTDFLTRYNLASVRQFAAMGQLETWIHAYLNDGEWANPGLSEGLTLQQRYWLGPLEMALDQLVRTCGPEPEMPHQVALDSWERRVENIAGQLEHPDDLPPLIVEYRQGMLLCL
jgi:hypothetical protein